MTAFARLIEALARAQVELVVIGGVALVSRGGARFTQDLDIVYQRDAANFQRLVLDGLERCKRAAGRPKDLLDLETIARLKSE